MSPDREVSRKPGHNSRLKAIVVLVVLGAALVWAAFALAPHVSKDKIEAWVRGAGVWGPLLLFGIQAAQILAAPVPGVFVPVIAGIMYLSLIHI